MKRQLRERSAPAARRFGSPAWRSAVQASDLDRVRPSKVGLSQERLGQIRRVLRDHVEEGRIAGATTDFSGGGGLVSTAADQGLAYQAIVD